MLNVKYFIVPTEEGNQVQQNPEAFGNAWFVNNIQWVESADEAILRLGQTSLDSTAIVNNENKNYVSTPLESDPSATIELVSQQPNKLVYRTSANKDQFAVFSEIYYPHGWKTFIDGKETSHIQADYVLRAMKIPAGEHEITFKFEPEVIETGSTISLISSVLLGLLLLGGIFYGIRKKDQ